MFLIDFNFCRLAETTVSGSPSVMWLSLKWVSAVAILDCSLNVYACGRQKALTMPTYYVAVNCNNCRSLNEGRSKNRNQSSLLRPTRITSRPFPDLSENWQFPFEISRVELSRMEIWKHVHQFYQTRRRLQPSKVFYTVRKHNYFVSPPTVWNDRPWKI